MKKPSSYATSNTQRRTNRPTTRAKNKKPKKYTPDSNWSAAKTKSTWPTQERWLQPQFARTVDLPILWTRIFRRVQRLHSVKSSSIDTAQDRTERRSPRSRDYPSPTIHAIPLQERQKCQRSSRQSRVVVAVATSDRFNSRLRSLQPSCQQRDCK